MKEKEISNKYQLALAAAELGIWEWNLETDEAIFDDVALSLMGYLQEDIKKKQTTGAWWLEQIHKDDFQKVNRSFTDFLKNSHGSLHLEFRVRTKRGGYVWIASDARIAARSDQGKPVQLIGINHEITREKVAEEALKESQERYQFLSDATFEGIIVHKKGILMDANDAFLKMTGYTREESIGQNLINYIPYHADRLKVLKNIVKAKAKPYTITSQRKDGSLFIAELEAKNVRKGDEKVRIAAIRDVTTTVNMQNALKESEERFRILAETSPMAIMVYQDGDWIYMNPAAEKISGYNFDELKQMKVWDIAAKDYREAIEKNVHLRQSGKGMMDPYEIRITHKNGKEKWVLVNGETIKINNKNAGFITILDIDDRKKTELALQESESILRAAMSHSQAGIAIAEVPDGRLKFVNQAGLLIRGKNEEELVKDIDINQYVSSWQILHLDGIPYRPEDVPLARAVLKGETVIEEFIVRRDDFEDRYVLAHAAPISNHEGARIAAIVVFLDITERKKSEEELRNSKDRLQQLNATKDKFFSIISHDLSGPMNSFLGLSRILDSEYDSLDRETQRKLISTIYKAAENTVKLLHDLLDWSLTQAKAINIEPVKINVSHWIQEMFALVREQANLKNIVLVSEVPELVYIMADQPSMNTVLRNLLTNAIKFTHRGGKIVIGAKTESSDGKPVTEIQIKDNGIGMPEEKINHLFHIQHVRSEPGTENEKGTGLGLIICKEFIEQNEGTLSVTSQEGHGTTFSIILPGC